MGKVGNLFVENQESIGQGRGNGWSERIAEGLTKQTIGWPRPMGSTQAFERRGHQLGGDTALTLRCLRSSRSSL